MKSTVNCLVRAMWSIPENYLWPLWRQLWRNWHLSVAYFNPDFGSINWLFMCKRQTFIYAQVHYNVRAMWSILETYQWHNWHMSVAYYTSGFGSIAWWFILIHIHIHIHFHTHTWELCVASFGAIDICLWLFHPGFGSINYLMIYVHYASSVSCLVRTMWSIPKNYLWPLWRQFVAQLTFVCGVFQPRFRVN